MNEAFRKRIDTIIDNVNKIDPKQLEIYDISYLKCKRDRRYLYISSIFTSVFLAEMGSVYGNLWGLRFANKILKCYIVLIIDLESNEFIRHQFYAFPINLDTSTVNVHKDYFAIQEQVMNNSLKIKGSVEYGINSKYFDVRHPISRIGSTHFEARGNRDIEFNFDIDYFVKNYIKYNMEGRLQHIDEPFNQSVHPNNKEEFIDLISCTCEKVRTDLRHGCFDCERRGNCNNHHVRKCNCGKFTYFRPNTCFHCYLKYTRSQAIQRSFNQRGTFQVYFSRLNSIGSLIPYSHYNGSAGSICIGEGYDVLNSMINRNINPLRLILSYKANLAYTDQDHTTSYYSKYRNRLSAHNFGRYAEFQSQLVAIFNGTKVNTNNHVFTVYCYCVFCLFVKITMIGSKKRFHSKAVEMSKGYLVSRDKFISLYKRYISRMRSSRFEIYMKSNTHKTIKNVVNTQPHELIIE